MKKVNNILFSFKREPEVLTVINELAYLESRTPHDSAKRLILEEGNQKITKLKQQSQE